MRILQDQAASPTRTWRVRKGGRLVPYREAGLTGLADFAAARKQHPWLAQCAFGYVIHDYVAMKDLLIQDDRMRLAIGMIIQIMGAEGTPWVNRRLGFGRGAHVCLGQFIARAQIAEGMHLIAQRLENPKLVAPVTWRPFYGVWGLEGLPIEFESAPRA